MNKIDKENKIFSTALKQFGRFGYKKTTLDDVAAALSMTKGNIYFYVKNKRDLYEKTVSHALLKWRDSIIQAVAAEQDVVRKFQVMAEESYDYLGHHDDLRSILIMDPDIFTLTPGEDRFYEINQGAVLLIQDILKQGIGEGKFHPVDIEHMSELLFSVYIMFLIKTYIKSEGSSAVKMFDEGLTLIMRGLTL